MKHGQCNFEDSSISYSLNLVRTGLITSFHEKVSVQVRAQYSVPRAHVYVIRWHAMSVTDLMAGQRRRGGKAVSVGTGLLLC